MARNNAPRNGSPLHWSAETWAFLTLRLFLGLRLLTAGWNKFTNEEGFAFSNYYDVFVNSYIMPSFTEQTGLPKLLLAPFAYSLGYIEIILGILLLLGVKTKFTLAAFGLLFVILAYGQMLLGDSQSISFIGIHILITAAALYFVRHNKWEALR